MDGDQTTGYRRILLRFCIPETWLSGSLLHSRTPRSKEYLETIADEPEIAGLICDFAVITILHRENSNALQSPCGDR